MPLWILVVILGVVEGITEFLPISSTGHLILVDRWLNFHEAVGGEQRAAVFEVFIQSGAILAIAAIYWERCKGMATRGLVQPGPDRRLLVAVIIGFIPIALVGGLFYNYIEAFFENPRLVATGLLVGGVLMLIIDRLPVRIRTRDMGDVTLGQAVVVGLAQALSVIPGTSRAAATIMGAICVGMDRKTATEFSFLLAFPVLIAASGFVLVRRYYLLDWEMAWVLLIGFVISFLVAWVVVKWFVRYIRHHTFDLFAWYRIALGGILLWVLG